MSDMIILCWALTLVSSISIVLSIIAFIYAQRTSKKLKEIGERAVHSVLEEDSKSYAIIHVFKELREGGVNASQAIIEAKEIVQLK